jgi:multiple antibiotic resistance protein
VNQIGQLFKKTHSRSRPGRHMRAVVFTFGMGFLLSTGIASAAEAVSHQEEMKQFPLIYVLTFLFLMLGPFKIIGPFAKITKGADAALTRQLALQATLFSSIALLVAAFIGEYILTRYGIPLPILALAAGIILFLVALQNILQQFAPPTSHSEIVTAPTPTLKQALTPLAFPTIVTPYGIAATIVFLAFSEDLQGRLAIGAGVLVIMLLNLIVMLNVRRIGPVLNISLAILGAVIGIIQVALGLQIINNSLRALGVL